MFVSFSREQMNREVKARREYAKKWSFMSKPEINQFYDQSHLNAKIDELVAKGNAKLLFCNAQHSLIFFNFR